MVSVVLYTVLLCGREGWRENDILLFLCKQNIPAQDIEEKVPV